MPPIPELLQQLDEQKKRFREERAEFANDRVKCAYYDGRVAQINDLLHTLREKGLR